MATEQQRERAREAVEEAVNRMLEAGFSKDEIRDEFEYALENADE